MSEDNHFLQRQDRLQAEAREVHERLQPLPLLPGAGESIIAGSLALRLMARRDIDIEM